MESPVATSLFKDWPRDDPRGWLHQRPWTYIQVHARDTTHPSLISFVVSVDIKHHVYYDTTLCYTAVVSLTGRSNPPPSELRSCVTAEVDYQAPSLRASLSGSFLQGTPSVMSLRKVEQTSRTSTEARNPTCRSSRYRSHPPPLISPPSPPPPPPATPTFPPPPSPPPTPTPPPAHCLVFQIKARFTPCGTGDKASPLPPAISVFMTAERMQRAVAKTTATYRGRDS